MQEQKNKAQKLTERIVCGVIFFTSILVFILVFMLPSLILNGKHAKDPVAWIIISMTILLLTFFGIMLFLLSTKFRHELILNDEERVNNWDNLPSDYKNFWIYQEIFIVIFGVFLFFVGIFSIWSYKEFIDLVTVIASISLLISNREQYRHIREKKEGKILRKVMQNLFIVWGILSLSVIITLLLINLLGRFL